MRDTCTENGDQRRGAGGPFDTVLGGRLTGDRCGEVAGEVAVRPWERGALRVSVCGANALATPRLLHLLDRGEPDLAPPGRRYRLEFTSGMSKTISGEIHRGELREIEREAMIGGSGLPAPPASAPRDAQLRNALREGR